ncbi:MAG: histidinol dehydrogenase [Sphingomonadales bacterium]|jgi:histidinol dehydrogenase
MPIKLKCTSSDFGERFCDFVNQKREADSNVRDVVADIIADVRDRGDAALKDYSLRFDGLDLGEFGFEFSKQTIAKAYDDCPKHQIKALHLAAERIRAFHELQKPKDIETTDALGVKLGARWGAMDAVGLYVPGGLASYPSSVLMNALPAKVAGVERISMVVPCPKGKVNPLVLAAAHIAGVSKIHPIGGAQAIAALAYGSESIASVDKIVGPGNAYVAEAKRQVFGRVGIDMIAGPSEILVVADAQCDPSWIAADLLSQAEHDETAQSILITDDEVFAKAVEGEILKHLEILPKADIAAKSWDVYGAIIIVEDIAENAPALINALAPEHLLLSVEDPEVLLPHIRHAGSIFMGNHTPEAIGDYLGGPNHVLPTGRRARFSSGLGVQDFMKRTTILGCSAEALEELGPSAVTLAQAEGLDAHALSVSLRLKRG